MKLNKYLVDAMQTAESSKCRYRHGCVVVVDGKVIARATNKLVRDQTQGSWRTSHVHAEMAALAEAGDRASGAIVYVARVRKDGSPAESKPCKKCEGILKRRKVKKVVWTSCEPF